jgi:hypothetical protein
MAEVKELSEADVMAMAQAHDEGRDWQPKDEPATAATEAKTAQADSNEAPPALPTETETKTSSSEGAVDKEAKATETTSTTGSLTTSDETRPDAASEKTERKPSRYERAKSRLEKEWDDLRAEKARFAAERETAQARDAQARQEAAAKPARKYSAGDYRDAAKSYRDEGNDDMARAAEAKATEVEAEERAESEARTQAELKGAWDQNLLKEVEANPELRDSQTPLYKAVSELLQQHAILRNYPAGISDAVGLAKMRIRADAASGLEKRLKDAEAELGRLRKATTPAASQPSAPAKIKTFDEMTSEEQGQELLRMAMEADRN